MAGWNFQIALYDRSPLQLWQAGTLELEQNGDEVAGTLSIPGFYSESIPVAGTISNEGNYELVSAQGKSSQMQVQFWIMLRYDGFLTSSTFCGGLSQILDYQAQETYLYVMQGATPST